MPVAQGPARRGGRGFPGFTLLELLVVLLLASMGMAMVLGMGLRPLEGMRLRGSARDLYALCRAARGYAVLDRSDNPVRYLPDERAFREVLRGKSVALPDDVRVLVGDGEEAVEVEELANDDASSPAGPDGDGLPPGKRLIVFYADGSADAALLTLAADSGARLALRVDPILGNVEILDAPASAQ